MKKCLILLLLAALDQLSKYLAVKNLLPSLGGFFDYSCNPNMAWSIGLPSVTFWLLWLAAIGAIIYTLRQARPQLRGYLTIVLLGAILNISDRLIYGCVVDFIALGGFPVFNVADIMITVGIALFIWQTYRNHPTKPE